MPRSSVASEMIAYRRLLRAQEATDRAFENLNPPERISAGFEASEASEAVRYQHHDLCPKTPRKTAPLRRSK